MAHPVRDAMEQAMLRASSGWFAEQVDVTELAAIAYNTLLGLRHDAFREGNDKVWGKGNWISCERCLDQTGLPSYHHRNYHDGPGEL